MMCTSMISPVSIFSSTSTGTLYVTYTTIAASLSVDGKPRSRVSQRSEAGTIVKPDMGRSCKEHWDDHASSNGTIRRFERVDLSYQP